MLGRRHTPDRAASPTFLPAGRSRWPPGPGSCTGWARPVKTSPSLSLFKRAKCCLPCCRACIFYRSPVIYICRIKSKPKIRLRIDISIIDFKPFTLTISVAEKNVDFFVATFAILIQNFFFNYSAKVWQVN
jgi:hypothetical protein